MRQHQHSCCQDWCLIAHLILAIQHFAIPLEPSYRDIAFRQTECYLLREKMLREQLVRVFIATVVVTSAAFGQQQYDYKVLATNKTSTMQKEMQKRRMLATGWKK
jgi:hypothetical protein